MKGVQSSGHKKVGPGGALLVIIASVLSVVAQASSGGGGGDPVPIIRVSPSPEGETPPCNHAYHAMW